jgi:3-keto-L-gulonate-6-phosphate decarboxylase
MTVDHPEGGASMAPETKLQLALDLPSLGAALAIVCALRSRLARVEVGTPLLLHAGVAAIEMVRSVVPPDVIVVSDTKICDAGHRIALHSFNAGADVVTVVGVALDGPTWRGVLDAARSGPAGPRAVLVDTVGWDAAAAGPGLRALTEEAMLSNIPVEICVHRPKDDPPPLPELFRQFGTAGGSAVGNSASPRHLIAGKMANGQVAPAIRAGFDVVIVGGAVSDSDNPAEAWSTLLAEVPAPDAEATRAP